MILPPVVTIIVSNSGAPAATASSGVEIRCNTEMTPEYAEAQNADVMIFVAGQRANRDGVNALRNSAPVVREIGDCVRPSNITSAIYMGYHAGLDA